MNKSLMLAMTLSLVFIHTQAKAAMQFDLICEGNITFCTLCSVDPKAIINSRYSIDLKNKMWCFVKNNATCDEISPIKSFDAGTITLLELGNLSDTDYVGQKIDRIKGTYWIYSRTSPIEEMGNCKAAPFTSFPTAQF